MGIRAVGARAKAGGRAKGQGSGDDPSFCACEQQPMASRQGSISFTGLMRHPDRFSRHLTDFCAIMRHAGATVRRTSDRRIRNMCVNDSGTAHAGAKSHATDGRGSGYLPFAPFSAAGQPASASAKMAGPIRPQAVV